MNLILHDLHAFEVYCQDAIEEPLTTEDGQLLPVDYAIMHPPHGQRGSWKELAERDLFGRFRYGIPSNAYGDAMYVLHAAAVLNESGKAAVIVPSGVLIRGASEQKIRRGLMMDDLIETVISLPSDWLTGQGVSKAILILNKRKPNARKGKVQFIPAEEWVKGPVPSKPNGKEIQKIIDAYRQYESIDPYSRIVDIDEIEKNEWSLNPTRYLSDVETQSKIFGPVRVKSNAYHASGLPLVHLHQIASIQRGIHLPPHQEQGNVTHYLINLSDVSDDEICLDTLTPVSYDNPEKLEKYEVLPGDLILASRGTQLKMAIVPDVDHPLLVSHNFIRIRPRNPQEWDAGYIKLFLESPLGQACLESIQRGTHVTVLSPKDVGMIQIPVLPIETQRRLVQKVKEADVAYHEALQKAERLRREQYAEVLREMGIGEFVKV